MKLLGPVARACLLVALVGATMLAPAPTASAAVTYRGATCTTVGVSTSISVSTPASTQVGDILIAAIASGDAHTTVQSPSPTTGWTQVNSWLPGGLPAAAIWYRKATAAGTTSYTFSLNAAIATSATMVAFAGADASTPIVDTLPSTNFTTGSGTAVSLPNDTATRPGSMRVSIVQSFTAASTSWSAGLTEACDQPYNNVQQSSVASAYESVNSGVTATRTATMSASASWHALTLIINPSIPCSTGGTALTAPTNVSFGTTADTGANQTRTANGLVSVDGEDASLPSWSISLTSTTFTAAGKTLPTTATTTTGVSAVAGTGNCGLPSSNAATYPVTVPAGATAPTAAKIYDGTSALPTGPVDLTFSYALALPANAYTGAYTSTWTFTAASGP